MKHFAIVAICNYENRISQENVFRKLENSAIDFQELHLSDLRPVCELKLVKRKLTSLFIVNKRLAEAEVKFIIRHAQREIQIVH